MVQPYKYDTPRAHVHNGALLPTIRTMIMILNRVFSAGAPRPAGRMAFFALAFPGVFCHIPGRRGEPAPALPVPELDSPKGTGSVTETAVLAGGCFWGVQ